MTVYLSLLWSLQRLQDRASHAGPVPGRVAPRRREGPGALHEQVEVVLVRVADRAVALEGLTRRERGGVGRQRLRHRHVRRRVWITLGDRPCGPVHERSRELDRDARVGEVVLDGL